MDFKFQGDFELQRKREDVYSLLTDPKRLAPLLPNLESLDVHDDREFTVKVKVGLAFMKSTAEIRMVLSEGTPFDNAVYKGTGKVAGEPLSLTAAFTLSGEDGRTTVNWIGESAIAGKMPAAAAKLLEPVARQSIRTLVESIKTALNQNQAGPVLKTEEQ